MAVQSDTSRIQYAGNNSTTTSYAVPFVFQENSHLKAIARTSAGVESVVTLTNHTGAGNVNGGTVRTSVAIPTTSTLTIYREVPATQTTTYAEGGDFPAASHERALDKLTYLVQQLGRAVARCVRLTDAAPESAAIPAVANQFFGTDANGAIVMVAGVNAAPESITNLSISPTAAIAGTKIAPNFGSQNVVTTGSVGIGTTSPTRTLHVNSGTTDFVARFESTDSGAEIVLQDDASTNEGNRIGVVGNDFRITTNNTERMRIDASGNVLIGTTSSPVTTSKLYLSDGTITSFVGYKISGVEHFGTHSNHPVAFLTNNTERMRIDASGNVGIGTSSATTRLHVADTNGNLLYSAQNAGFGDLAYAGGPSNILRFGPSGYVSGGLALMYTTSAGIRTEAMRIDASGNVGIGTSSPAKKLDVFSSGTTTADMVVRNGTVSLLSFVDAAAGYTGTSTNHPMLFTTNNTERMRIASNGNTGIGTGSPSSRLHIAGDLTVSSGTTATTASTTAGGSTLPALAAGYLVVSINGTSRKIPYYAT